MVLLGAGQDMAGPDQGSPAAGSAPKGRSGRALHVAGWILFVALFAGLIAWFKGYDLYHRHFNLSGLPVAFYNLSRLVFAAYFFLALTGAGAFALRLATGGAFGTLPPLQRLFLAWFSGAGVVHIVMLALGLMGGYSPVAGFIIAVPLVALAYPFVIDVLRDLSAARDKHPPAGASIVRRLLALAALTVCMALALVKGLYPAGGHDYYLHYFYYYTDVIANGGLKPNEVWYHFFYSKGAGTFFLAMLLTDPLAPQLVTLGYVFAGAGALYLLCERLAPRTAWPWAAAILWLGIYIYTPGKGLNAMHGGWGDFEKLHELTAALCAGVVWTAAEALLRAGAERRAWAIAAGLATIAAIIVQAVFALFLGATFGLGGLAFLFHAAIRRDAASARSFLLMLSLAIVAGLTLTAILAVNYAMTGLLIDQGLLLTWRYADIERLREWGALYPLLQVHQGLVRMYDQAGSPASWAFVEFMFRSARLPYLWPALLAGGLALPALLFARKPAGGGRSATPGRGILLLGAALLAFIALGATTGLPQEVSFYRFSSFAMVITLAISAALAGFWRDESQGWPAQLRAHGLPLLALAGSGIAMLASYQIVPLGVTGLTAARFATGQYSIDAAYVYQPGWPGRLPFGGIYPGARAVYERLGPNAPVVSFHVHTYCMLPDCKMKMSEAFALARDFDRVMYGPPDEARSILRREGYNYFLFTTELGVSSALYQSRLFSPQSIGEHLGIAWTDGVSTLLTWKSNKTQPLDEAWIKAFATADCASCGFPHRDLEAVYDALRADPQPWTQPELPWLKQ